MTKSPAPPVPALFPAARLPADRNPVRVYLASLASGDGRRLMAAAAFGLMFGCGLRRSEAVAVRIANKPELFAGCYSYK